MLILNQQNFIPKLRLGQLKSVFFVIFYNMSVLRSRHESYVITIFSISYTFNFTRVFFLIDFGLHVIQTGPRVAIIVHFVLTVNL